MHIKVREQNPAPVETEENGTIGKYKKSNLQKTV